MLFGQLLVWTTVVGLLDGVTAGNRPPSITHQARKEIIFKSGTSVEITCEAQGIPAPSYTWKKNGEAFIPNDQDVIQLPGTGTIKIRHCTGPADKGIYQCFAENEYGVSVSDKSYLREAILGDFYTSSPQTHRVMEGDSLTLFCVPPVSRPKPVVLWVVRIADRFEPVSNDTRFSVDLEGRLHILTVMPEDGQDGKTFSCMVVNELLRESRTGPEHTIQVVDIPGAIQVRPPSLMWASPSDQLGFRGEGLILKCIFDSYPIAMVMWVRVDSHRRTFLSVGQQLRLYNLKQSNSGQYECFGFNSNATMPAIRAFTIRIVSAPFWKHELQNKEAHVGETATFICDADGDPAVHYQWFINGVPLDGSGATRDPRIYGNRRFQRPNAKTIALSELTLGDHFNIQCNASNVFGYVFSDVYLTVLDTPGHATP